MFEDFKQDKLITHLSEFLDTLELIGVPWEVEVKQGKPHIIILDRDGDRVAQFIFDEFEHFQDVFKS